MKNPLFTKSSFGSIQVSHDERSLTNKGEEEAPKGNPCICGFNGPIAKHLRVHLECVRVLKEQIGIGEEMSDEEFCIRAGLLVGECPAFCCQGGDHTEIPESCVKWWKSVGWETMRWEGHPKDVTSDLIKHWSNKFVKDLEDGQVHQQSQMNQIGRRGTSDGSQRQGNSEDRLTDNPNQMSPPAFSPPKLSVQAASPNRNHLCRNVAEVEYQETVEKVKAISRSETPGCLHVKELIHLGIRHAASLGILCRWPSLPINGNEIVPMNGNCIWTCFVHANNTTLRGALLEQAVWELRIRAVGTFIDRLKLFEDEQWSLLQAIATGGRDVTPSRDRIRQEMEKYMESGEYSGDLGDIILNIAVSFSQQPVLVIKVSGCKVTNSHWVDPNKLFGGRNHSLRCPLVFLSQLNHYELLLIAEEAKDTARMKYQQWKASERVCVSPDRENLNENLNPSAVHDVVGSQMENLMEMLEPDGTFSPPLASTPLLQQHHDKLKEQQTADHVSEMDCDDFINQVVWLFVFILFVCLFSCLLACLPACLFVCLVGFFVC